MMKRLKIYVAALLIAVGLGAAAAVVPVRTALAADPPAGTAGAAAQEADDTDDTAANPVNTACAALGSANCTDTSGGVGVGNIIKTVITILSWVVGIAAIIMIIYSGFRYVTSRGDANAVSAAKNTLIYALVGIVIVVLAQAIVAFVIDRAT